MCVTSFSIQVPQKVWVQAQWFHIPRTMGRGTKHSVSWQGKRWKAIKGRDQRLAALPIGLTLCRRTIYLPKKMESNTSQDNIVDTYKNWVYLIIPLGSSIKNAIMPNYEVESGNTRSYDDRQSHTNNGIQWHSQLHPYGRRQHTSWLNHPCASTVASAFLQCDHRIGAC